MSNGWNMQFLMDVTRHFNRGICHMIRSIATRHTNKRWL